MNELTHMCIVEMSGKDNQQVFGLLMTLDEDKTYSIRGFKSEADGIEYFESAYRRAHLRGYEASMSACLNSIFFRPSIIKLSIPEVESLIEERKIVRAHHVSGMVDYLPLVAEKAEPIWEKGTKPALFKDEWLR